MNKKILVVDDDPFLIKVYKAKLAKSGFDVETAQDGEKAIEALGRFMPDLILLDLVMPKKDGFATLSEIKKNESWKSIPVIVTTNLGQHEDIEKIKNMGVNDYLIKSDISIAEIVDRVKKKI